MMNNTDVLKKESFYATWKLRFRCHYVQHIAPRANQLHDYTSASEIRDDSNH